MDQVSSDDSHRVAAAALLPKKLSGRPPKLIGPLRRVDNGPSGAAEHNAKSLHPCVGNSLDPIGQVPLLKHVLKRSATRLDFGASGRDDAAVGGIW